MKLKYFSSNITHIKIGRIIIIALASIALLAELLPEVKAKPIVITTLIITISFVLFEFRYKREGNI